MRPLAATCLAGALALVSAAQAQPSASSSTAGDARCLLEMVALSNSTDANQQHIGQSGAAFFAGRIKAHDPSFAFTRLKPMATSFDPKAAQTDLQQRCGPMYMKSMQELQAALAPPASASRAPPPPPAPPHRP